VIASTPFDWVPTAAVVAVVIASSVAAIYEAWWHWTLKRDERRD